MPRVTIVNASSNAFTDALAILNRDLEEHERAAAELRGLVSRLTVYATNGAANGSTPPPVKHAGGRPVIDPNDKERARKALLMRQRRARLKAAEAAKGRDLKKNGGVEHNEPKAAPPPAADIPVEVAAAAMSAADGIAAKLAEAETLAEVIPLANAAKALIAATETAQDVSGFRSALQLRLQCEQRGGELLQTMERVPTTKLGIANCAQRWREVAALDEELFQERLAALGRRWPKGVPHKADSPAPGRVEINISKWSTDENGVATRTLVASGEPTPLKHERLPAT